MRSHDGKKVVSFLVQDAYRHIHLFHATLAQQESVVVPLCDCVNMRPHGDLFQSMKHAEYTVEGACMCVG